MSTLLAEPRCDAQDGADASPADSATASRCWPLDDARLRWYAYARVAFWHLLGALRTRPGDNIVMPDLICDVMTEPLHRLGLRAHYYRCEPLCPISVDELQARIDERTRAVLAVHHFGFPADLREVAACCERAGVPLVEDASQALFSGDPDRPVGHCGAAVLFSFRKTLKLPHGAGLICRDPAFDNRLDHSSPELPKPRRDVWRFWIKRVDRRWFGGACEQLLDTVRGRGSTHPAHTDTGAPAAVDPFDTCLVQPSRTARWLTLHADVQSEIARRRELFASYAARWQHEHLPGTPLLSELPDGWVPYAFVLEPEESGADATARRLQTMGLPAEPWPRLPHDAPAGVESRRKVLCLL